MLELFIIGLFILLLYLKEKYTLKFTLPNLTKEQFEALVEVNSFERFMDMSGQYDDDPRDRARHRAYEKQIEKLRKIIPPEFRKFIGKISDSYGKKSVIEFFEANHLKVPKGV